MRLLNSRMAVVLLADATIPIFFFIIIFFWVRIDSFLETREEAKSIGNLRAIADRWLRDPRVHTLWLDHDPTNSRRFRIRLDVDDKATCEKIVEELVGCAKRLPDWDITIRNGETFEVDYGYGYHAEGMALAVAGPAVVLTFVFKGIVSLAISFILSLIVMLVGFSL